MRHRWHVLATIVALLGALGLGRYGLLYWRPVGTGPAGVSVPAEPFTQTWSDRRVLLLGIGDSVTAGFGAEPGYGYFDRLTANPPVDAADMQGKCLRRVFPHLETLNLSVSGSTSLQHADRQIPRLPAQSPDTLGWVVMTTGGNDLIHNYGRGPIEEGALYGATWQQAQPWGSRFERRLGVMLDALAARFPGGCQVFLANIYDPTDGVGDLEQACLGLPHWPGAIPILAAYNEAISRCAQARPNVHLVDLRTTFLGHGLHCREFWCAHYDRADPTYWYFGNLEDPNPRGYDAVRRAFLLEMLTAAPSPGITHRL